MEWEIKGLSACFAPGVCLLFVTPPRGTGPTKTSTALGKAPWSQPRTPCRALSPHPWEGTAAARGRMRLGMLWGGRNVFTPGSGHAALRVPSLDGEQGSVWGSWSPNSVVLG